MNQITTEEIRNGFEQMIAMATDPDQVARLEVAREYFTNPAFKAQMHETIWQINQSR